MKNILFRKFPIIITLLTLTMSSFAQEYEIVEPGTAVRWNFWASEGLIYLRSSNTSFGNRFRLGGEVHFSPDYRWLFGITIFDVISTKEYSSGLLGNLSRGGTDLDFGYFLVPDRLWIKYSLVFGEVESDNILGPVDNLGHSLSLGYRFYNRKQFNIAVELSYLYFQQAQADYFDPSTNTFGTATYPPANSLSLNFKLGFDIGGRSDQ